jgi:hypothetical protein
MDGLEIRLLFLGEAFRTPELDLSSNSAMDVQDLPTWGLNPFQCPCHRPRFNHCAFAIGIYLSIRHTLLISSSNAAFKTFIFFSPLPVFRHASARVKLRTFKLIKWIPSNSMSSRTNEGKQTTRSQEPQAGLMSWLTNSRVDLTL